jgi:hypothetical protein
VAVKRLKGLAMSHSIPRPGLCLAALLLATGAACSHAPAASAPARRAIVGAIRWDAWHGDAGVPGREVETSLSPAHWRERLPFYGRVLAPDRVQCRANTPEVMEQEIAYARAGGLDYWAFAHYRPGDPMTQGLQLYLRSPHQRDINFCLLLQDGHLGPAAQWPETVRELVGYIGEASYQTVLGDRPLVYLLANEEEALPRLFGSRAEARRAFDQLRAAVRARGRGEPYLVLQHWDARVGARLARELGFDALSAYATKPAGAGRRPFAELADHTRRFWDQCAQAGLGVVPLVMSGWDRRPRQENPVPWEHGAWTADTLHFAPPTPDELGGLVRDALAWTAAHRNAAPAEAVLIYAWNETDEGGWLVPTRAEGTARLDALRRSRER